MKQFNKVISILLCAALLILPINHYVNAATKVKINKKTATIYVGKTVQLKVTGTKKKVVWKSSNKKIATVTSKGKVKGIKKGTATITATVSKKKYSCKITVKEKVVNKTTPTPKVTQKPITTETPKSTPTVSPTDTAIPTPTSTIDLILAPTSEPTSKPSNDIYNTDSPQIITTTPPITVTQTPLIIATTNPPITATPSPIPTQTPVATLDALDYCNIAEEYTSKNGFLVSIESISNEMVGTNYLCKIQYSLTNNTTEILDCPIFRVFDEKYNVYTQYGVFNKIYPGASINKTYTFSITNIYRPIILELVTNIRESYITYFNEINPNELHWKIPEQE